MSNATLAEETHATQAVVLIEVLPEEVVADAVATLSRVVDGGTEFPTAIGRVWDVIDHCPITAFTAAERDAAAQGKSAKMVYDLLHTIVRTTGELEDQGLALTVASSAAIDGPRAEEARRAQIRAADAKIAELEKLLDELKGVLAALLVDELVEEDVLAHPNHDVIVPGPAWQHCIKHYHVAA